MITLDAIRSQLSRILASPAFDAPARNRRFLEFVVQQAIEGRADRIKAYTIATDVFHRGTDFDPQLDSIVRIEAGRLRRSLEHYYLTAGVDDPVRIAIPKGSYVPVFTQIERKSAAVRSTVPAHQGRLILVQSFDEEGDHGAYPNFTRGFTRQLIVGLTRFTDLFVLGNENCSKIEGAQHLIAETRASFIVSGSIIFERDRLKIEALLMDTTTGRYVWAEEYDRALQTQKIIETRDEIANKIIRSIAQPHGAIFRSCARDVEGMLPHQLSSQDSVVRFYQYTQTYDRELFAPAFTALTETVERERDYAEAHACLAQLHVDAYRFGFDTLEPVDNLPLRALNLALRAVELAPESSRSHHALATAYWFRGDVASSLAAYQAGMDLNPNDAEIMVDFGFRYAMLAQWDKAMPLLEAAFERNPYQPSTYRIALSLYHLAHGRYAESLVEARRVVAPDVPYGHLLRAVGTAHLGYREEALSAVAEIAKVKPNYGESIISDLRLRNIHPTLIRLVASGLAKAGMDIDLAELTSAEQLVQVANRGGRQQPPIRSLAR